MTTALKEQIVTLPCLHTLVLMVDMRCNILTAFVPKLILPSLRALEYHDTFNMDWGASQYSTKIFHALSVLVKNSQGAALEFLTLRLRKMGFDESAFREFRSELPALTSLDVEDQYSTPEPEIVADDYFERSPAH
ncbi:hypothetical protein NMY22_g11589 [Coprinellus aureogranulatus]|nr:hypothetical protein NMY22_g11589 [Coprinellus aureogranulatus]